MASRSVTVILRNTTRDTIIALRTSSLSHGQWDVQPPGNISEQMVGAWTSQSDGVWTGTQGFAQFSLTPAVPGRLPGAWSLRQELAKLASFLPAGFSAANGIRSLFPPGYTGSISQLRFFVLQNAGAGYISVNWDNPYAGSNSYSGTAPSPYTLVYQGGVGDNAVVMFTLTD